MKVGGIGPLYVCALSELPGSRWEVHSRFALTTVVGLRIYLSIRVLTHLLGWRIHVANAESFLLEVRSTHTPAYSPHTVEAWTLASAFSMSFCL